MSSPSTGISPSYRPSLPPWDTASSSSLAVAMLPDWRVVKQIKERTRRAVCVGSVSGGGSVRSLLARTRYIYHDRPCMFYCGMYGHSKQRCGVAGLVVLVVIRGSL